MAYVIAEPCTRRAILVMLCDYCLARLHVLGLRWRAPPRWSGWARACMWSMSSSPSMTSTARTFTARLVVLGQSACLSPRLRICPGAQSSLAIPSWGVLPVAPRSHPPGARLVDSAHVDGRVARVYPMFLLAPEPSGWPGRIQLWGLAVGAPVLVTGLSGGAGLIAPGAAALGAAAAGHVVWVISMARAEAPGSTSGSPLRPRRGWLPPLGTVLGLALAFDLLSGPRVALAYAVLVLGGWASLSIVGMMLKIVPFLVWYRVYSPQVGRTQVPTLAALGWPAAEAMAWVLLTGGILALALAAASGRADLIAVPGVVLATGALAFAASLGHAILHLVVIRPPRPPRPRPWLDDRDARKCGQPSGKCSTPKTGCRS